MMRSLYSGVAGLRTHQTKMDVLGNNIANVNTTSFKSQSITFSDLMYQTTQTASGATATKGGVNARQIGLGAKSGAIATAIESQGATQTTNNPFDIMITGKSFFVVNNGKENLYTRDGSFYVDGAGNLAMQSNGYLVQGWVAQEDRETGEIKINRNGGLAALQIMSADNSTYSPASTTAALYSGNIDDHDTNVTSDDGKTITLEFYDNKGYLYTGKFTLKDTTLSDADNNKYFNLSLTDVIDSDGNSIGEDLLKGITFGEERATKEQDVVETYRVDVANNKIYLLPNATAYEEVPASGTVADLMNPKASYFGILESVYGVKHDDINQGNLDYTKNSTFTIDEFGILTVYYDKEQDSATPNNYTYNANNTNSYYVNSATGLAYQVPTTSEGYMNNISSGLKTTLEKVFNVPADELATYTGSAKYKFAFESVASGDDTFKVYRNSTLKGADEATKETISKLATYKDDFEGLEAALATATDPVFYTFKNNHLEVYGSKMDVDGTVPSGYQTVPGYTYNKLETGDVYTYSTMTTDEKKEMADVFEQAGLISDPGTPPTPVAEPDPADYTDGVDDPAYISDKANYDIYVAELEAYNNAKSSRLVTALDEYMAAGDGTKPYTNVMFGELTGTNGIMLYTKTPQIVADETVNVYSGDVFSRPFRADESSLPVSSADELGGVYTNSADGSAYVLFGDEDLLNDYSAELLEKVYGLNKDTYDGELHVTILSSGKISLYQNEKISPELNSDFSASKAEDGKLIYKTKKEREVWSDVPMKGTLGTLREAAAGPLKGVMSKVFGITDEQADAFGDDATYEISNTTNENGTLIIKSGEKSVQLVFNPANGALVSANGNSGGGLGLVRMIFDQNVDGLEAFGFQEGANDDPDFKAGQVMFDFSAVTNYNTSGSSTIKAVKGDKKSLNTGRAVGEMNGVNVSTDGQIFATYSNGQTKLLGQIASAEFANASGLSKEGDNLYSSTLNSGEATIQDITTDGGYMNTGVLEMSNVDLSREFTEMITTQRGFQANSRIITVSDTLLEELTNLKR